MQCSGSIWEKGAQRRVMQGVGGIQCTLYRAYTVQPTWKADSAAARAAGPSAEENAATRGAAPGSASSSRKSLHVAPHQHSAEHKPPRLLTSSTANLTASKAKAELLRCVHRHSEAEVLKRRQPATALVPVCGTAARADRHPEAKGCVAQHGQSGLQWAAPLRGLNGGCEDDDALGAQRAQQRQRHQRLVHARAHHLVLAQLARQRIPGTTGALSCKQKDH